LARASSRRPRIPAVLDLTSLSVAQVEAVDAAGPAQGQAPAPGRRQVDDRGSWPAGDLPLYRGAYSDRPVHPLRVDPERRGVRCLSGSPENLVPPSRVGRREKRISEEGRDDPLRPSEHVRNPRVAEAPASPVRQGSQLNLGVAGGRCDLRKGGGGHGGCHRRSDHESQNGEGAAQRGYVPTT
jgi:hypothetical protein